MQELHLRWLATEVAKTTKSRDDGLSGVLRALRLLRKDLVETDYLVAFESHLRTAECTHHVTLSAQRLFGDACNTQNLIRFLWDYMTTTNIPRFRDFFKAHQVAQLYTVIEEEPSIAYSVVFDSPSLFKQGQRPLDEGRVVLYTLVLPRASTRTQWSHLARSRSRTCFDRVFRHVDAQIVDGVSLAGMRKFVARDVVEPGNREVLPYSLAPTASGEAPASVELSSTDLAMLEAWDQEAAAAAPPKLSKKRRRRLRVLAAARVVQRVVRLFLARVRSAVRIQRARRALLSRRALRAALAARVVQRWVRQRHCRDLAIARRLASFEAVDQCTISASIEARRVRDGCTEVLEALIARVEREAALSAVSDALLDEVVGELAAETGRARAAWCHAEMQRIQAGCGALKTFQVNCLGTVYQMHVAATSETFARRDDPALLRDLLSDDAARVSRLFAARHRSELKRAPACA